MICPFCFATDQRYFEVDVCRRCLPYRMNQKTFESQDIILVEEPILTFALTQHQIEASRLLNEAVKSHHVFLEAVCGAGKTEMCLETIKDALNQGKRVGWAIPRRQIVLELASRFKEMFPHLDVIAVCEGYTENLEGDLIFLTTHQLFRFHQYFDLLIVDEPDAFPFAGNDLLKGFMRASCKGHVVFLSATMEKKMLEEWNPVKHIYVPLRPSLKPLPIPVVKNNYFQMVKAFYSHYQERCLIFVPTRKMAAQLSLLTRIPYITSQSKDKEAILETFSTTPASKLITTTVLERGVTFSNVFVFVLKAHHAIYTTSSLIQISGRVMRGKSTQGKCYFHAPFHSLEVNECIEETLRANEHAQSVLNPLKKAFHL